MIESLSSSLNAVLEVAEKAGLANHPSVLDARRVHDLATAESVRTVEHPSDQASDLQRLLDEARDENTRLRETNKKLHRRVQQNEGPAYSYAQRLDYLRDSMGKQWIAEFERVIRAHTEVKRIFLELARVYPYPMNGTHMHSVMDMNASVGRFEEGVFANCFLTKAGGMQSFRVLDEVKRAVDELILLRSQAEPTTHDSPARPTAST